ncbi:MAG: hypothetical protein ACYDAD_08765 [Acidimicrobiales bacterium]
MNPPATRSRPRGGTVRHDDLSLWLAPVRNGAWVSARFGYG